MVDLKQVGKLFNDAITAIRDDTPDLDALEPQALEWLKSARYKVMRDVEKAFYELESARDKPLSQPTWAVDPTAKLIFLTENVPAVLDPFRSAMSENLNSLLKDCGFHSNFSRNMGLGDVIFLYIQFPAQLSTGEAFQTTRALHIEDEFSPHARAEGAFGAGNFGRLLTDARAGAESQSVKEEDGEGQDEPSSTESDLESRTGGGGK
ncbi:hypothetical protein C8R45DRAFT_1089746 [Mycena sanguinolenta]|nr:hypothetical protein C8R45DRAFT_1089746 [Mycena sanguinolenta]